MTEIGLVFEGTSLMTQPANTGKSILVFYYVWTLESSGDCQSQVVTIYTADMDLLSMRRGEEMFLNEFCLLSEI